MVCNHMGKFLATPEQVNCNLGHLPGEELAGFSSDRKQLPDGLSESPLWWDRCQPLGDRVVVKMKTESPLPRKTTELWVALFPLLIK